MKRIFNSWLVLAVGAAERKNPNGHKYATFEVGFLHFHGQKISGTVSRVLDVVFSKAMKSSPLFGPFCGSGFWEFFLLKI